MNLSDILALFRFELSPWELVLRGTAMYWFLFVLFRFVLRRDTSSVGVADILLLVIVADAAQNAMAGPYQTVAEGMLLVATIAGWNLLLDWLAFNNETVRRFVDPPPVVLVRRGRIVHAAMRRELITVPELMGKLREQGVDKLAEVKIARIESGGDLSVIKYEKGGG